MLAGTRETVWSGGFLHSGFVTLFYLSACLTPAIAEKAPAPRRIVSDVLAADEILAEIVSVERIAAVSAAVDNPAISNAAHRFGQTVRRHHGTVEEILSLHPDLVFVAAYSRPETVSYFERAHVPVVRLSGNDSFRSIFVNIRIIGRAVGESARSERLVQAMERELAALSPVSGCGAPRVLYYSEGGITAGRNTVIDEMIFRSGGVNVAAQSGLAGSVEIPLELLLSQAPEVIVLPGWLVDAPSPLLRQLTCDRRFASVPAVRRGAIYTVRSSALTSLSQHAVQGTSEMTRLLREYCQAP